MSQIDALKGMLGSFSKQIETLGNLKNMAQSKIDNESGNKINAVSSELTKAINDAKKGSPELLNKFISNHANINK